MATVLDSADLDVETRLYAHSVFKKLKMVCWDSLGKDTGVGSHSLLQGIFLIWGSNLGLLHCRQIYFILLYEALGKPHNYKNECLCICNGQSREVWARAVLVH